MSAAFVTFEGTDGTGKSTQIRMLADALRAEGHEVVQTREPGGSAGAEEIRGLILTGATDRWSPMTELLLFMAARSDHVERVIEPALARGAIVLCDRYVDTTRAYQGAGGELGDATITELHAKVIGRMPDLTLLLDIEPEQGLRRAMARQGVASAETRMEMKGLAFQERLRAAYLEIAETESHRVALLDASGGIEDVASRIRAAVDARLGFASPEDRELETGPTA